MLIVKHEKRELVNIKPNNFNLTFYLFTLLRQYSDMAA